MKTRQSNYLSDIAALRSVPLGLYDAYRRQIELVRRRPIHFDDYEDMIDYFRQDPRFAGRYQQDIDYLREIPGTGEYEQAVLTTANERVDQKYDAARQRILMEAGRQGIEPSSGVVKELLQRNEEARAAEKAQAERNLAMWRLGEMRSRRAEARTIDQMLDAARTARLLQALGLGRQYEQEILGRAGMETGLFREADQYEQARRAQARAIEAALEQAERQRLLDLLAFIQGGQPPSTPAGLASQQAQWAAQMAAAQQAGLGEILGNLGQSLYYYYMMGQKPPALGSGG